MDSHMRQIRRDTGTQLRATTLRIRGPAISVCVIQTWFSIGFSMVIVRSRATLDDQGVDANPT